MTVDIRATVTCSLGTLISGSLSDDYLQGSGLIKTRGTVEIDGLITPALGTIVTFTYTKNAVLRNVPRRLRVMSSFADPYRRTTKVELGCKLTYFSDLQEPLDWDALDDPENAALSASDQEIVTIPIYAKSIAAECCNQLGINPAPVSVLTNKFSIAEFDFSSGYVQILSDLLVSESYCGYLSETETLVLIDLSDDGGTGPALTEAEIVDLGPIGVGQLPGEAVIVEYSTLKLRSPDESVTGADPTLLWEINETSYVAEYYLSWRPTGGGALQERIVRGIETTTQTRRYEKIAGRDLVVEDSTTITKLRAGVCGNACQEWLSQGNVPNSDPALPLDSTEITNYTYDENGNIQQQETLTNVQTSHVIGKGGLDISYPDGSYIFVNIEAPFPERRELVTFTRTDDPILIRRYGYGPATGTFYQTQEQSVTETSVLLYETIEGQQTVAGASNFIETAVEAAAYYNKAIAFGPLVDRVVAQNGKQLYAPDERPPVSDLLNSARGQVVQAEAETVLALGSLEAQRRITFRMPYAPDDVFSGPTGGPFTATPSDAEQKAITYGRVQNRLLMGNRSGMNLQIAPEKLPAAPFAPMFVQANGLTAMYRANGNQWAFSSDGIAVSTDALFWGAVGGTGTFWFPVAPGVVTLPSTPPTDGNGDITVTAGEVIPAYNETVLITLRMRTRLEVTPLLYSLSETFDVTLVTYTKLETLGGLVDVPAAPLTLTAHPPLMSTLVNVPAAPLTLNALAPVDVGFVATALVQVPTAAFTLAAVAPSVSTASVFAPVVDFAVTAHAPALPRPAPEFESTQASTGASSGSLTLTDVHNYFFRTPVVGEVTFVYIEGSGNDSTLTPPTGWAAVPGSPVVDVATSAGSKLQVWWRRLDSSDTSGPVDLVIGDGGDHQTAFSSRISGCVSSGDPWDVIATGTDTSAVTALNYPSVTTTRDNTLVLFAMSLPFNGSASSFVTPFFTNANLTGTRTQPLVRGTTAGNDGTVTANYGTMATAGVLGVSTATVNTSSTHAYMTIALRSY